ncbi:unnamed protein product [Heligmosomoides polygyrus]|uniref:Major sperm protein n=1 Tax=Heligmosomoides polygyrus TaxID=6339 RepID=A0A183F7D3_HELPZ|nr:unnamed protein product [Heligmosomoides polygyrus]
MVVWCVFNFQPMMSTSAATLHEYSRDFFPFRGNVTMDPPQATFAASGGKTSLTLLNAGENRIVFKVRCSNIKDYRINPVFGFVDLIGNTPIEVIRLPGPAKEDKIVIQFAQAPADAKDAMAAFKKVSATSLQQITVPLTATGPGGAAPAPAPAAATPGAAASAAAAAKKPATTPPPPAPAAAQPKPPVVGAGAPPKPPAPATPAAAQAKPPVAGTGAPKPPTPTTPPPANPPAAATPKPNVAAAAPPPVPKPAAQPAAATPKVPPPAVATTPGKTPAPPGGVAKK